MASSEPGPEASELPPKATGSLNPPTGPLLIAGAMPQPAPSFSRDTVLRFAEVSIFLVGVIGAVALGLGITAYFAEHSYVYAYLLAYAGFRFSDLLVRDDSIDGTARQELGNRIAAQLPLLLMFAAAPFERTYVYGGTMPESIGALGLLLELLGMWLTLGARIQLGYFSRGDPEHPYLVRSGFYRYIRHPVNAGTFLVALGWPLEYGAPVTLLVTLIIGVAILRRRIASEEKILLARFGEMYETYQRETDAVIPTLW
ncbi:MAG: isoprenylcysteine carboxylmethyltransferase family protein [Candidatus Binatus sp.]|uniref:methyltransferase family protein n=1 Tax=Candidatus Binatus sp. TaxID=2811406 RepID=UPI0027278DAE|nr:isoprenylcysteine carboxylmethyltransferase family protein [Candidatus Binatus sp.]MDO8434891.1 isoprenylcysteine carboxylmethyltransferase family protein [Candidatus Binatus sp.]